MLTFANNAVKTVGLYTDSKIKLVISLATFRKEKFIALKLYKFGVNFLKKHKHLPLLY